MTTNTDAETRLRELLSDDVFREAVAARSQAKGSPGSGFAAMRDVLLEALLPSLAPGGETPTPAVVTKDTSDGYHTFGELYAYRKVYNALLFNEWAARGVYDVHKSWRHSNGELCFAGGAKGWFIVVAQTPHGQVSNHYEADDWPLFQVPERFTGAAWDGHTPQVAFERLLLTAKAPEPAPGPTPSADTLADHTCVDGLGRQTWEPCAACQAQFVPPQLTSEDRATLRRITDSFQEPPEGPTPGRDECAGPFVSAFDCPVHDPRKAAPQLSEAVTVEQGWMLRRKSDGMVNTTQLLRRTKPHEDATWEPVRVQVERRVSVREGAGD